MQRLFALALCVLAVAGCGALLSAGDASGGDVTTRTDKAGARLAPDIRSETWLNGPRTSLKDLRGQVVLIDFWTFG